MSKHDSKPDRVEHTQEDIIPVIMRTEKTIIHKDDETYSGLGWSREEADRVAGEKYSRGEKDKD